MMHDPVFKNADGSVVFVSPNGRAAHIPHSTIEIWRAGGPWPCSAAMLARARPAAALPPAPALPEGTSPKIIAAHARGPVQPVRGLRTTRRADGSEVVEDDNHLGQGAIRQSDAFDRMADAARRAQSGGPFTASQVSMARAYRALTERHNASGLRGMSLETIRSGGGGGDWIEAVLRDRAALQVIHRRIGTGIAKSVRRQRPSAGRLLISDRRLVDCVCLGDMVLADVLAAHGWKSRPENAVPLRQALCAALDRMAGPVASKKRHTWLGDLAATQAFWDGRKERA